MLLIPGTLIFHLLPSVGEFVVWFLLASQSVICMNTTHHLNLSINRKKDDRSEWTVLLGDGHDGRWVERTVLLHAKTAHSIRFSFLYSLELYSYSVHAHTVF